MNLTNEQIINGLKQDKNEVFDFLYRHFGPKILGYVINNSGTEEDGYETLQTAILKVWKKVKDGSYKDQGKFKSYFFSVAANTWMEQLRTRKRKATEPISEKEFELRDYSDEEKIEMAITDDKLNIIYAAMQQLGEVCQELIRLFHLKEIPLKEIATMKDMEYGAVRKRIFDCRKRLQKFAKEILSKTEL